MSTKELQTRVLGDYELVEELGVGMLGKVYLAQHRFLKKPFVIKILPEELAKNDKFIKRFEKEVALLSTLDHPNIAKLQNVSSDGDVYFLVSDCLMGAKSLLEVEELSEEEIFSIAKQVASALDHAHQKNIGDEPLAHRGLKLNNIILKEEDGQWKVQVADFGLSRIVGIGAVLCRSYRILWEMMAFEAGFKDGDLALDHYGEGEGDVERLHDSFAQYYAFLAPEQRGRAVSSRDGDVKADVYAFGIMLYCLLVGKMPEGFFPMPSECNLDLKRDWDRIIKSCLDVDPEKRPLLLSSLLEEVVSYEGGLRPKLQPQEIARPQYEPDPAAIFQVDKTVAIYTPTKTEPKEIEPILTEMVVVEGGTFLRGSNNGARDEMPRHAVHLPSFAIDVHPVTNEQFVRFLMAMGGEKDANNNDIIRLRDSRIRKNGGKLTIESGYSKHPVVGVSWYGAMAYAKWVGKRLPTEAEWEVAAYGGTEGAQYPTGDDVERSGANFFNADTTSILSYPPNSYGLYDMAGNVYEWCLDWYGYHFYETSMQEPENPTGPAQGVYRVLRGGCWKSLKEDMRCSHRHRNNPGIMNGTYGFRCCAAVAGQ
ncbi:MAG: bifunctional serine/threonine-protein kinase/formylglycine-generating enzyme family protein [Simkaniaceae bacterium]|nr:bifunctional serine/threonine-protein kinase/formylglycine-generating enzyme family protein [Candidatus Sacchlamyda saccharinae]